MKDHPLADCTTYPLTEIYRLRERLQRVETERDLLKKQVERLKKKIEDMEYDEYTNQLHASLLS